MPYHPTLQEVLNQENPHSDEWAEFTIDALRWGIWVSAERVFGEQPESEYSFVCSPLRSEYGTFSSSENVFLYFELTSAERLKELGGDPNPLGSFSYYEETIVTLRVTPKVYNEIISLISSKAGKITVRVSLPQWDDAECKCIPITQYQMTLNSLND